MTKSEWLIQPAVNLPGLSKSTTDFLDRFFFQRTQVDTIIRHLDNYQGFRGFGTKSAKEIGQALLEIGFTKNDSTSFSNFLSKNTLAGRIDALVSKHGVSEDEATLIHKIARSEGWISEPLF